MTSIRLSAITIFPVKSLAGINLSSCAVTRTGLQYDRKWMLVDETGNFLSQRKLPRMALIKTAITENHLILSAPGKDDLYLPLAPTDGELTSCIVWEDLCTALKVSELADQWLSTFLQTNCRLVYFPESSNRYVDPDYGQIQDRVAFSDGFPFLLIAENSLNALNTAMQLTLPMSRFRPNLVVSGCGAYEEDTWREIAIGEITFRLPKPCSRCAVPAIDQETAAIGKEPLTTLNRTRKWQHKVYFGQNALHNSLGVLSVGDSVTILETGTAQPPL